MRNRTIGLCLLLLAGLVLGGCSAWDKAEVKEPRKPEKPPEVYRVKFETTKGDVLIEVTREWAPYGADHFFDLVQVGFYDGARFFRVVRGFVVQFGINGDPDVQRPWGQIQIPDDPVKQSNKTGFISFAKGGPNSRTTQVFINLGDNIRLDKDGFAPFGRVIEGMDVVEGLWGSYGEMAPRGTGPSPAMIGLEGNAYLDRRFPRLDAIRRARVQPAAEALPPKADQ